MTTKDVEMKPGTPDWLKHYLQRCAPDTAGANFGCPPELFDRLANLNAEEMTFRANEIKRLLRNSGFIELGEKRRWQLDPVPLLMAPDDWDIIRRGIEQRIRLINGVLADLTHQQQLLTDGTIPARLLMNHANYLHEWQGDIVDNCQTFMVAMDIGKHDDGQYYLLDDHCQYPRGLGLLLENRIVARRVMSEEFAQCGVSRIATFFQQLQHAIGQATSTLRDPRVVILSRGPDDPFYSEQAYLATYLGYTLVRSADLTVRKGMVWLKALDGLRKVDVILRWIEDRFLDSLEQTEYSEHGIPGLLQAVRAKSVILLNPFANGLMQMPAIRNHLADAASQLLDESLILPDPAVFSVDEVEASEWPDYQLRSYTDPSLKLNGNSDTEAIRDAMATHDHQTLYFRRNINLSSAPFWQRGNLSSAPVLLRCFALNTKDGIHVLPSALCMTPARGDYEGRTAIKDTWVQSPAPQEETGAPTLPRKTTDLALLEGLIPSRTAENLFWLGCSLERCENVIRMLRLVIDRFTEMAMYPDDRHKSSLIRIKTGLVNQSLIYPYHTIAESVPADDDEGYKSVVFKSMTDTELSGSLAASVAATIYRGMQVRELLSYDSLRIIEKLESETRRLQKITEATPTHTLQSLLDRTMSLIMAFNGSILDSMSISNGSFMLEIGRRLERSRQLVAAIETLLLDKMNEADQQSTLEALLIAQVSSVTHRRRYRMYQSIETGLELLLLDADYPRSLAYQISQLATLGKRLPSKSKPGFLAAHEKILLRLRTECALADRTELATIDAGRRNNLASMLNSMATHLKSYNELLQTQYFSHTRTATKRTWSTVEPSVDETEPEMISEPHSVADEVSP